MFGARSSNRANATCALVAPNLAPTSLSTGLVRIRFRTAPGNPSGQKANECDVPFRALLQDILGSLIRKVEEVPHTDDLRLLDGAQ
jgi:hypothetical protein